MLMALERERIAGADGVRDRPLRGEGNRVVPAESLLGREQLVQIQRARILRGMVDAVCARGIANTSVADVVASCGTSRRTFYEIFEDRDACFLAAFDEALALATTRVLPVFESATGWLGKLRGGLTGLLAFIDVEPKLARLLIYESLSAGPVALERRTRLTRRLAAFVGEGRKESRLGFDMSPLQAEGAVGGALAILQNMLASGHDDSYLKLTGPLMAMLVMPYLGPAAARREIDRPIEARNAAVRGPMGSMEPLDVAGLRLTYRTARVLLVLADRPGASNRQVGQAAEIGDQGQASKLLKRLQRAGLVENTGPGPRQGAANQWRLTDSGSQLAEGIRTHIQPSREADRR